MNSVTNQAGDSTTFAYLREWLAVSKAQATMLGPSLPWLASYR